MPPTAVRFPPPESLSEITGVHRWSYRSKKELVRSTSSTSFGNSRKASTVPALSSAVAALTEDVLQRPQIRGIQMETKISPEHVYYIKLGRGGEWEEESLRDGILHFGYAESAHELCEKGDWDPVWEFWYKKRGDAGTATRDVQQIRAFYESTEETLFITFHGGLMYWCRPTGPVQVMEDGSRVRNTVSGWSSESVGGDPLRTDRLSGHLQKVQMFRGTICTVKARDYLLRKLNDEMLPEVAKADEAEEMLRSAIVGLLKRLTWQDFELLVDLVFSTTGWRRVGVVGRAQKTVDIELWMPSTEERAFVQVKSQATASAIDDYVGRFEAGAYDRMFFVWHSGSIDVDDPMNGVHLLGPDALAKMVMEAGLSSWLKDKVS